MKCKFAFPVLCLMLVVTARAEDDPLIWRAPSKRPEFRQLVGQARVKAAVAEMLAKDKPLKELVQSKRPAAGLLVRDLAPGGVAARYGFLQGDIVVRVDKQRIWSHRQAWPVPRGSWKIEVHGAQGGRRILQVGPDLSGLAADTHWDPALVYAAGRAHDKRWDDLVLCGIRNRTSAPDLAETCWRQAIDAGYPRSTLSAAVGAELAFAQGRPEVAATFAAFARQPPEDKSPLHPEMLFRIAMANYKLPAAVQTALRNPSLIPVNADLLYAAARMHELRDETKRTLPPPHERIKAMFADDILSHGVQLGGHIDVKPGLADGFRMNPNTDRFTILHIGPEFDGRNIELSLRFSLRPTNENRGRFRKEFNAALVDERGIPILRADLDPEAGMRVIHTGQLGFACPWEDLDFTGDRTYQLRLLRVDGQGEIFLDGRRILHVPLREEIQSVAVYLKAVGMLVDVKHLQATEWIQSP